jgi:single-stranded-DNA-specific exonuclease
VALGTIADVVPLDGNNRILVSHGMKVLSEHRRPGIEAMVNTARIHARTFTAAHISFQLAPRLNAAGRLSDAMNAFELLVSTVQTDAMEYAGILEQMTHERREIEAQVSADARRIAAEQAKENPRIMVVNGAGWHKGVLGIVAARLSDEFQMPVYVIGVTGGVGTGSARGAGQLNLYDSLDDCAKLLLRYGGHRDAAGFSVTEEHIPALRQRLQAYADGHWTQTRRNDILCDATLHPSQLTRRFYNELQLLGPFGFQNLEPVFQIDGLDVLSARVVGNGHLKLQLKTPTGSIAAFGPGMGAAAEGLPSPICVAASLSSDEWWGDDAIELRLVAPPVPGGVGESF